MASTPVHIGVAETPTVGRPLNLEAVRADFPILDQEINGSRLVYFDNAATAQKPRHVIDAVADFYRSVNSNVHRGVHTLSQRSTDAYEEARRVVAAFLNARSDREIIFTAGTTNGINLVSASFAMTELGAGDEVVVTEIEHHSNFVPWQEACRRSGARLVVVEADDDGNIDLNRIEQALSNRTKLIAITHVSNTLGSVVDLKKVVKIAHDRGVLVASDGAQAVPHMPVDVQDLDIDFYAFSGHKLFGPMGVGVLYGKEALLDRLHPVLSGGGMIDRVTFAQTTWADLPHKLEAGTPNVAGAVGLAAAVDYMSSLGFDAIESHENDLTSYMVERLSEVGDVRIFGPPGDRASVFSIALGAAHPFDVGSLLDQQGIAVRTGHHCNQPLMVRLGIPGTVRASLAFYNTTTEIDRFAEALKQINSMLG